MHVITNAGVDVADNHEGGRRGDLACEEINGQKIEADDNAAVRDGFDEGAFLLLGRMLIFSSSGSRYRPNCGKEDVESRAARSVFLQANRAAMVVHNFCDDR